MGSIMTEEEMHELLVRYRHLDNESKARDKILADFRVLRAALRALRLELNKVKRSEKHYMTEMVHFADSCARAEAERDRLQEEIRELMKEKVHEG